MDKNYIVENCKLDSHQMQLLKHNGNSLVVAGAGSGKTLTILGKVNYLIEHQNVSPKNILLISFTNASVNDIKSRLKYNINVYTFHKLAIYILEKSKYQYTLLNYDLLKYIIKEYVITAELKEQKVILRFLKLNISFKNFLKSYEFTNFCGFINTFINLFKTNNYQKEDVFKIKYTKIEKEILIIIFKIYKIYFQEKKSMNKLDFDDLITYATKMVKNTCLPYKYIIVDEFQDTSFLRLNLIREIFKYKNTKIIVVGDDYQSIYHFSGCDLNIFLNFNTFFPDVLQIQLINTYRNSQELINIASLFILKNKNQIPKKLSSHKHSKNPIVLCPYNNEKKILSKIFDYILNYSKDIIVLSRNNKDIYAYLDANMTFDNNFINYKNNKIPYMTVHKAKGLEAEYVIVLNCNNCKLGFPNKILANDIINKLFPKEKMPFAEERRLFYVAITRSKEKTFLVYNQKNPSIFIREIKRHIKKVTKKIIYLRSFF